jgi:hypothetical protein
MHIRIHMHTYTHHAQIRKRKRKEEEPVEEEKKRPVHRKKTELSIIRDREREAAQEVLVFNVPITDDEIVIRQVLNRMILDVEKISTPEDGPLSPVVALKRTQKLWKCQWCYCSQMDCGGTKAHGPDGPGTLCSSCGGRYKDGHLGPLVKERGKFLCDSCNKRFETVRGLSAHRRGCTGGAWKCQWCSCAEDSSGGRVLGPNGPRTLCMACGQKFRAGHTSATSSSPVPHQQDAQGKFVCPHCEKKFDSSMGLGGHKRFCDGGQWHCTWCKCTAEDAGGKMQGPDGPKTLCSSCGNRYKNGHSGPPQKDDEGNFVCDDCGRRFETSAGLGGHRRFCSQLTKGRAPTEKRLIDDSELDQNVRLSNAPLMNAKASAALTDASIVAIWDCLGFIVGEVLGEHLALTWDTFHKIVMQPKVVPGDLKAGVFVPLIELLYSELPGATDNVVFKGRPLNRYTWQELLRQFLAAKACEYATTLTPNISEDDALLCQKRRRADGAAMSALALALGEKDFDAMEPAHRFEAIEWACNMCLDSTKVHKHIEKGVEDGAKLLNRKREEFAARMKELENEHKGGHAANMDLDLDDDEAMHDLDISGKVRLSLSESRRCICHPFVKCICRCIDDYAHACLDTYECACMDNCVYACCVYACIHSCVYACVDGCLYADVHMNMHMQYRYLCICMYR